MVQNMASEMHNQGQPCLHLLVSGVVSLVAWETHGVILRTKAVLVQADAFQGSQPG